MAFSEMEDVPARRSVRLAEKRASKRDAFEEEVARKQTLERRRRRLTEPAAAVAEAAGKQLTVSQDLAPKLLLKFTNETSTECQCCRYELLSPSPQQPTLAPIAALHPDSCAARRLRRYRLMDQAMHLVPGLQCTPVPVPLHCRTRSSTIDLALDPAMFAVLDDKFGPVQKCRQYPVPPDTPTSSLFVCLSDIEGRPSSSITVVPPGYGPTAISRLGEPAARNPPPRRPKVGPFHSSSDPGAMIGAPDTAEGMASAEYTDEYVRSELNYSPEPRRLEPEVSTPPY